MPNTQIYQTGLFWFTEDLRIEDNDALMRASETCVELICIYVVHPKWFKPNRYGLRSIGEHRWRFLRESLIDLETALANLGQRLLVVFEPPLLALADTIEEYDVNAVYRSKSAGFYENRDWEMLRHHHPKIDFHERCTHTLFTKESLPVDERYFTAGSSFTRFLKEVEPLAIDQALTTPRWLTPPPRQLACFKPSLPDYEKNQPSLFKGGSKIGKKHLLDYFSKRHASKYKTTRNELDGWNHSTKFSPWLANGSISARQIFRIVKQYERDVEANESTYWIVFELLWREFFQWSAHFNKTRLFSLTGTKKRKLLTTYYPERFTRWCKGTTPYPLVNACMNQLNVTGYMSNRGRQIVASCLVNELSLDWRYGAAYFEQQLIDYDVAVNWGNWQYLAGVGADPVNNRHFDIDKQTRIYDPSGEFIHKWNGDNNLTAMDSVDASDWPISS